MKKIRFFLTLLLLGVTVAAFGQNIRVSGIVTDATSGEPVIGASIQLKGSSTTYAMTDVDGRYTINVPTNGVLVVNFLGYVPQEVNVDSKSIVDIALALDVQHLEDVIVVAFGTATKESFTGSAAVVNNETLQKSQATTITSALSGAVPGVQLTSSNGAPGASATIRIRGFGSLSAGNDPLIIVDGAPYSGDLANLSQSDIESMTVLKDATSNALYGARGANGVIMITTKKAKRGEALVTFDAKYGVNQRALVNYNTINDPALYYETHFGAMRSYFMNQGQSLEAATVTSNLNIGKDAADAGLGYLIYTVPEGQFLIGTNGKMNPNATLGRVVGDYYLTNDNWQDYGYRTGNRQEYTLSVAGANEKANFYSAISYLGNQGITDASDMTRFTGRLKADYQAKPWMKVGANVSYSKFEHNSLGNNGSSTSTGNIWAFTSRIAPIYPLFIRTADGNKKIDQWGFEMMDYGDGKNAGMGRPFLFNANALSDLRFNTRQSEGNASTGNAFVDFKIIDGLKVTINGTYNLDETRTTLVYNPYYGQFTSTKGLVEKSHSRSYDVNFQQLINYDKTFGKHTIGVLLGHEYLNSKYYIVGASKNNMFSQDNKELSGAVVDGQSAYSYINEYNNEGYFTRLGYDYDTKIFFTGTFRREASSRFAVNHRWGSFWSVGASWLMNRENWFNASWIDELKLKASIGSQGNDNIGSYRYTDLYDIVNSSGSVATMFSTKGSENITWETNTNINAGVEFSLFKRLTGSIEYYYRKTSDMLFSFSVAPSMGYSSYYANVGDMRNTGAELNLNLNIFNTKNVSWDINANVTYLKNKILMLHNDKKTLTARDAQGNEYQGYNSGSFFIGEDLSMYSWYMKEFAGVDQTTGESLWYMDEKDDNGELTGKRVTTNAYSDATYYVAGKSSIAPIYGGFGTTVNAYGFDFSINFSYQIGGLMYDSSYAGIMAPPTSSSAGYAYHADILKAWTKENPSNTIPRFTYGDQYAASSSTRFLTDASYLNINNINVGYTLPARWTKKVGGDMCSLRIYAACENVWYWSKRQGFDPRVSYTETGNAFYSPMRTISGGLTIKF